MDSLLWHSVDLSRKKQAKERHVTGPPENHGR